VRLLDRDRLERGETGFAQLFLREPAVTTWNQPFVLRSESPVLTIGGGRVLYPDAEKIRQVDEETMKYCKDLRSDDLIPRASAALYFAGLRNWQPRDLSRTAGVEDVNDVHQQLQQSGDLLEIAVSPTRTVRLHSRVFGQLCDRIAAALLKLHQKNPLRSTLDRAPLVSGFSYLGDAALINAVLDSMNKTKRIKLTQKGIALVGQGPKLSQNEQKLLAQIVGIFREAGLKPPTVKECQQQATKNRDSVPQLISLAVANGDLVEVGPDFHLHIDTERDTRGKLTESLGTGMTMSEIRELLGTTRKYAVPLCEFFDKVGFTKREGDLRVLAPDTDMS